MVDGGDLVDLVSQLLGFALVLENGLSYPNLSWVGGIYSPSRNIAVGGTWAGISGHLSGRIIRGG